MLSNNHKRAQIIRKSYSTATSACDWFSRGSLQPSHWSTPGRSVYCPRLSLVGSSATRAGQVEGRRAARFIYRDNGIYWLVVICCFDVQAIFICCFRWREVGGDGVVLRNSKLMGVLKNIEFLLNIFFFSSSLAEIDFQKILLFLHQTLELDSSI